MGVIFPIVYCLEKNVNLFHFFSLILQTPKPLISNTPVFDESVVVDNLLTNNEANYESTLHCAQDTAGSPSLSKVTMGDITTFLAKSGHHQVICLLLYYRGSLFDTTFGSGEKLR